MIKRILRKILKSDANNIDIERSKIEIIDLYEAQGWICIETTKYKEFLELFDFRFIKNLVLEEAFSELNADPKSEHFVVHEVNDWSIIIGKHFFEVGDLREHLTEISKKIGLVLAFVNDPWSNYFLISEFEDGVQMYFHELNDSFNVSESKENDKFGYSLADLNDNRIIEISNIRTLNIDSKKFILSQIAKK